MRAMAVSHNANGMPLSQEQLSHTIKTLYYPTDAQIYNP